MPSSPRRGRSPTRAALLPFRERPGRTGGRHGNKKAPVVLPETIDTWGERASAALPHRRRNGALNAPRLKRSRRPRRAPKGRPRRPEGEPHPNPAPKGRDGCIEARPLRHSGAFLVRP